MGNCKIFCWVILTHSTCLRISVRFHIWMELTFIIYLILFVIILDDKSLIRILTTPLTVVKLLLHSFLWLIALISDSGEWQQIRLVWEAHHDVLLLYQVSFRTAVLCDSCSNAPKCSFTKWPLSSLSCSLSVSFHAWLHLWWSFWLLFNYTRSATSHWKI